MYLGEKFEYYEMGQDEKERVLEAIRQELAKYEDILLAIVFGSFVELKEFRDIDIAIYSLRTDLDFVLELGARLEEMLEIPIDVIPLIDVSPRFRYYILTKGRIVLERVSGLYEALLSMTFDDLKREELITQKS